MANIFIIAPLLNGQYWSPIYCYRSPLFLFSSSISIKYVTVNKDEVLNSHLCDIHCINNFNHDYLECNHNQLHRVLM